MKQRNGHAAPRRIFALLLALTTLGASWLLPQNGGVPELSWATFGAQIMRSELFSWHTQAENTLSLLTTMTLRESALLMSNRTAIEKEQPFSVSEDTDSEVQEGLIIDPEDQNMADAAVESDNGVAAKTIHPTSASGYLVWKNVYIYNSTDYSPDLNALMSTRPAATFTDEMPQILILHTHGTEAYTMPKGQEYKQSSNCRTLDTEYNVVRIGDEIASVFEEAGISVLHDRTLYDASGYSDAYDRAEDAIAAYLEKYPSIHFVLDIHRDAIEDSDGTPYKVISQVNGQNAAQMSIVVGTDGGGLSHDHWQENLKLAVLLQQSISEAYPTLMRPMYLRNSRYNEHATTGSLLIEVGAAGNSLDEALLAARLFAQEAVKVFQELRPETN